MPRPPPASLSVSDPVQQCARGGSKSKQHLIKYLLALQLQHGTVQRSLQQDEDEACSTSSTSTLTTLNPDVASRGFCPRASFCDCFLLAHKNSLNSKIAKFKITNCIDVATATSAATTAAAAVVATCSLRSSTLPIGRRQPRLLFLLLVLLLLLWCCCL